MSSSESIAYELIMRSIYCGEMRLRMRECTWLWNDREHLGGTTMTVQSAT